MSRQGISSDDTIVSTIGGDENDFSHDMSDITSTSINIKQASMKLLHANYLLITTGAGFSADSGLQTYECAPVEYRDMCNPFKLTEEPYNFQRFWLNFTQSYKDTMPHKGYEILDQWCNGGRLKNLSRSSNNSDNISVPWYVYTSNVDNHFNRFSSFKETLCAIHGSALQFRCACGIGYAHGQPRMGNEWDTWNEQMTSCTDTCKQTTVQMSPSILQDISSSDDIFSCTYCNQPMRPNVLMFHDTDDNVLRGINNQRERYQAWEAHVEEEVATKNMNMVILELGCGTKVPAVREESEEVLLDTAKKIKLQEGCTGSVCLIRINPKDADITVEGEGFDTISIESTAANALQKIDSLLKDQRELE